MNKFAFTKATISCREEFQITQNYPQTRKGYWRVARNPIIAKAISAERLKKAGYLNFSEYYESARV